jgi:dihydrofolate reductase
VTKVFFDTSVSLDGFVAGPNARPDNPLGDGGLRIHEWLFRTATFVRMAGGSGGDEHSTDDVQVQQAFARAGAHVIGRRMFDEGEVCWPEEAPFRMPVFVLTHHAREPWVRKGGTVFHFVTDGFTSALAQAKAAAGGKDVRIGGGADVIRQALDAGAIDDFTLHTAPVLLGSGTRLFDHPLPATIEQTGASHSPHVVHAHYRVRR